MNINHILLLYIHFYHKYVNKCFGLLSSTWYLNSPDMQFIRQQQCKIYWHFLHSIACNKVRELVLTCQQNYSHSIPNWGWNFTTKSLIKSLLMLRIISNFFLKFWHRLLFDQKCTWSMSIFAQKISIYNVVVCVK